MINWSEYDHYCHKLLGFLYANRLNPDTKTKWLFHTLHLHFPDLSMAIMEDMLAILYNDGFIDSDSNRVPTGAPAPLNYFSISHKGVAFVFNDTYMNRRAVATMQIELLKSQSAANESVIETNQNIKETNENIKATNINTNLSNNSLKSIFRWTLIVAGVGLVVSSLNAYEVFRKDTLTEQLHTSDSLLQVSNSENVRLKVSLDSAIGKPSK